MEYLIITLLVTVIELLLNGKQYAKYFELFYLSLTIICGRYANYLHFPDGKIRIGKLK